MNSPLDCISPIDGRYSSQTRKLAEITSEKALIHYRLIVEIAWLETLSTNPEINCPAINKKTATKFKLIKDATPELLHELAANVKNIEQSTMHDVKACEYFIRELVTTTENADLIPWIHFACTSEDINNTAYAMLVQKIKTQHMLPEISNICMSLVKVAESNLNCTMLGFTHGQAASPTTFGKELLVFVHRLIPIIEKIANYKISAKFNGAVGNYNAHYAAYPNLDWPQICSNMIIGLGLEFNELTTQISNHDNLVGLLCLYKQAMLILQDLSQDLWLYAHKNYIILRKENESQVGSSTMPHKINPIDFENAEGNISMFKAITNQLIEKLPISRLQRDLSDSTTLRNIGSCCAYASIACLALEKGIKKISSNQSQMQKDLTQHWETLTEAIQTIMRKHGIENAYELLKQASQGQQMNSNEYQKMLEQLAVSDHIKREIIAITPSNYVGIAQEKTQLIKRYLRFLQQFVFNQH